MSVEPFSPSFGGTHASHLIGSDIDEKGNIKKEFLWNQDDDNIEDNKEPLNFPIKSDEDSQPIILRSPFLPSNSEPQQNLELVNRMQELEEILKEPPDTLPGLDPMTEVKQQEEPSSLISPVLISPVRTELKCLTCGRIFQQEAALRMHRRIHTGERAHQCKHCDKQFVLQSSLMAHEPTHKERHKCGICSKIFALESNLFLHKRQYHVPTVDKEVKDLDVDEKEKRNPRSELKECEECGAKFKTHSDLGHHQARKHEPKICSICSQVFLKQRVLDAHVRIHHTKEKIKHACSECEAKFSKISHLKEHVKAVHQMKKDHACEFCGQKFGRTSRLIDHIRRAHTLERPFPCRFPYCGMEFATDHDRQRHEEAIHHGDSFSCSEPNCGKGFTHKLDKQFVKHQVSEFSMEWESEC